MIGSAQSFWGVEALARGGHLHHRVYGSMSIKCIKTSVVLFIGLRDLSVSRLSWSVNGDKTAHQTDLEKGRSKGESARDREICIICTNGVTGALHAGLAVGGPYVYYRTVG